MSFLIRKVGTKDKKSIERMMNKILELHYDKMPDICRRENMQFTKEEFNKIVTNDEEHYMTIAEDENNNILGFHYMKYIKLNESKTKELKIAYMDMVYVKDEYKRYGVGEQLLNDALREARDKKEKGLIDKIWFRVWQWNNKCQNMIKKNNAKEVYSVYEID